MTERIKPLVRFENVGMRHGRSEILREIDLRLSRGSFHFLTGPSGAGKSSLLDLIHVARRPTTGRVFVCGNDVAKTSRRNLAALRRRIGVVYQDLRLLDHLPAFDNLALPLRLAGARASDIHDHVTEMLSWVGLGERSAAPAGTLSRGERQRLAASRAVVGRPSLLLADEPISNVDQAMGARLMHLFEELNRIGTTVLIATQDVALAARSNHARLRLKDGLLTVQPSPG